MRYVPQDKVDLRLRRRMEQVGNIDKTGSVRGMCSLFGWTAGGQVRVGGYIYNVGTHEVERLRRCGLLRG